MKKQEHKYAQVLRWIADGEKVQMKANGYEQFIDASPEMVLYEIADDSAVEFRLAPRTIIVNGVEVPAPERDGLKKGEHFFVPDFESEEMFMEDIWVGTSTDKKFIERGIVYLTKEHAIARAKAMLLTQE